MYAIRSYYAEVPPAEELHRVEPGPVHADPAQLQQLPDLRHRGIVGFPNQPSSLPRERGNLPGQELHLLPLPFEPMQETLGKRRAVPPPQPRELPRNVLREVDLQALVLV